LDFALAFGLFIGLCFGLWTFHWTLPWALDFSLDFVLGFRLFIGLCFGLWTFHWTFWELSLQLGPQLLFFFCVFWILSLSSKIFFLIIASAASLLRWTYFVGKATRPSGRNAPKSEKYRKNWFVATSNFTIGLKLK
jgi:hypothetical protein